MKSRIHDMNPNEVIQLVRMHGVRKTCAMLKVGSRVMARFLHQHGFDATPAWTKKHILLRYLHKGMHPPDIAKQLGCHADTIYKWLNHHGLISHYRPWTAQEEKYLRFMAYQEPWPVIAEKLNRTVDAVQVRTRLMKIKSTKVIGYTTQDIANDTHMKLSQVHTWIQQLGLKSTVVETCRYATVNPIDFYEWLSAGNVLRIEDISKCAHWLKEIHANAMQEYITTKEINYYANKVMDYATRQDWPNRNVPQVLLYLQRHGYGNVYRRAEVYEWLKHYRYTLPRRITNTMPNYLWWRDFANEWDHHYIYKNDLAALIDEYESKINHLQRRYGFPKSIDTMHAFFVRAEIVQWIHATKMYTNLLPALQQDI